MGGYTIELILNSLPKVPHTNLLNWIDKEIQNHKATRVVWHIKPEEAYTAEVCAKCREYFPCSTIRNLAKLCGFEERD